MKVITLCGSLRFREAFEEWNERLTLQGNVVLSVEGFRRTWTLEQIALLAEIHRKKIDLSDEIFVIDVDGYIGDSTRAEIDYARQQGKGVRYLSEA